jgi:endonuclease-3
VPSRPAARGAAPRPSKTSADTRRIIGTLTIQHPNADTALHFSTPYQLLVATILSAQCTDERVNQVTPALFKRYPDARALARATTDELEPQIQSTGFFRAKSRSLVGMASAVVERHGGEIPKTMTQLVELPGVGRKTANVVLGHALGVPGLPVDRHVLRVANRIGIARSEDAGIVEQQLCAAIPPERWTLTSDTLILHGRRICKPRPQCDRCAVRQDCDYFRTVVKKAAHRSLSAIRRAATPSGTSGRAQGPERGAEPGSLSAIRRAATPSGTSGRAQGPERGAEPGSPSAIRRAATPSGTSGRAQGPERGAEPGSLSAIRRAATPSGTSGRAQGPERGAETGSLSEIRRAAKPRGAGGGGGAPPPTKE